MAASPPSNIVHTWQHMCRPQRSICNCRLSARLWLFLWVDGLACVGFCLGLSLQWALWALSAPPKRPAGYTGVYRGQVYMCMWRTRAALECFCSLLSSLTLNQNKPTNQRSTRPVSTQNQSWDDSWFRTLFFLRPWIWHERHLSLLMFSSVCVISVCIPVRAGRCDKGFEMFQNGMLEIFQSFYINQYSCRSFT